jgi:DsbC/DsbD-like thiol-disulfide interchange protein
MNPVSAAELAQIRADVQTAVCDQTCVIKRKSVSPDGLGSETETFSTIATTIAGMAQPSAGELQNYDFVIGDKSAWKVHLPYGTNVTHQDHLLIAGQTLVVQVLLEPHSYAALYDVIASEIK